MSHNKPPTKKVTADQEITRKRKRNKSPAKGSILILEIFKILNPLGKL